MYKPPRSRLWASVGLAIAFACAFVMQDQGPPGAFAFLSTSNFFVFGAAALVVTGLGWAAVQAVRALWKSQIGLPFRLAMAKVWQLAKARLLTQVQVLLRRHRPVPHFVSSRWCAGAH